VVNGKESRSSPARTPPICRGASWGSRSSSSPPAGTRTGTAPGNTWRRAQARDHLRPGRKGRTRPSSWASTRRRSTGRSISSSPTPPAHELPRPGRQGAARHLRDRARPDDHDPLLHERPEDPRPAAQGPAAGAGRGVSMIPDDHGSRQGRLARHPELKGRLDGMAIRVPHPERFRGGPDGGA